MTVTLDRLEGITLEEAWRVAFRGEGVDFSERARTCITDCRAAFERLLASGDAGFVYGSTAAPGARAKTKLSKARQEALARSQNLWAPRAFGGGAVNAPEHAVRLVLFARLAGYIEGHGRIRLETAEWIAALLAGAMPRLPLDAATGPGEVMPLSWLYPGLSERELAAGEIMSLYNGSPCATGFVTDAALTAARRLRLAEALLALAIEAPAAPLDAYDPALQEITADPQLRASLRRLNGLLEGVPLEERLSHQAPVSWRIIPQILAVFADAVQAAERRAEASLRSVAHNPVYLPPDADHLNGRAISPGGFHNQQASRAIDQLNAAGADLCALATKLTSRLMDGGPFGLPKLLVAADSGVIGTEFLAWSQTSHAERARQSAMPAVLSIGLEDPGGGQSDVAVPVFLAYERYLDVADAADASLATLALTVLQAFRISGRQPPPKLQAFASSLDNMVAPFELERIGELGDSLRRVKIACSEAVVGQGELAPFL